MFRSHIVFAALLCFLLSAAPVHAGIDDRSVQDFLARYIDLSNARDLESQLAMYSPDARIVLKGEERGESVEAILTELYRRWDRRKVVFDYVTDVEVREMAESQTLVSFNVPLTARFLGFNIEREVAKELTLEHIDGALRIAADVTPE